MSDATNTDDIEIDLLALIASITPEEIEAETARREVARVEEIKKERPRCMRCSGSGFLYEFRHVSGGRCFGCDGTGRTI